MRSISVEDAPAHSVVFASLAAIQMPSQINGQTSDKLDKDNLSTLYESAANMSTMQTHLQNHNSSPLTFSAPLTTTAKGQDKTLDISALIL